MRLESYRITHSSPDISDFEIELSDVNGDKRGYPKRKVHTFLGKHFRRAYGKNYRKFVILFSYWVFEDERLKLWGEVFFKT